MNNDMLMDQMEEERFRKRYSELTARLARTTHFSVSELQSLLLIYSKLTKKDPMDRKRFAEVMHTVFDMTSDCLMDRIFSTLDKGSSMVISMENWVQGLSMMLRGSLEEKIKYVFSVYDILGDGFIIKDTMFTLMHKSLVKSPGDEDVEEGVRDMVDVICRKLDLDRDGKVSFSDFRTSCLKTPLLLEALGECIPGRMAMHAFLTTFTSNVGRV